MPDRLPSRRPDPGHPARWAVPLLVVAAALGRAASTGPQAAADEPRAPAPTARLLVHGQEAERGTLLEVEASGVRFRPAIGDARLVPWDGIVELSTGSTSGPAADRSALLWRAHLVGGEVLLGTRQAEADDTEALQLDVAGLGIVRLPLEALRRVEALPPDVPLTLDRTDMHPAEPGRDVVYDEVDDRLSGTLLELGREAIVLEDEGGRERSIAWSRARTLHVAAEGGTAPAPLATGLSVEVELTDGSRIPTASPPRSEGAHLVLVPRSLPSVTWRVPRAAVATLRARGGSFDYATYLPFTSEVDTGTADHADVGVDQILAQLWRTRVDRRADGRPLIVGGTSWRHGFAVHSTSRVRIDLDGKWSTFEVGVGVDDSVLETAPGSSEVVRGDVGARVLGDDRVLWEAASVKGGEGVTWTGTLDVSGVKTLTLEVDRGPDGLSTLDRADWVRPLLVRAR
ncbi:MAG: NPCBM/NEW2 domain-containing protein [Planctomycetota bacterium]